MAERRLKAVLDTLSTPPDSIGTLKLGNVEYQVLQVQTPSKLPTTQPLDVHNDYTLDQLKFLLQKYILGQDIFLVSQPGPYARRLALTFASIINSEYEYIALHRDIGETELKQGRELSGGNLRYTNSPAVNAVKFGRLLIIEGIEKAERGIMPILNNLLENREMNLDDGTHIVHPMRFATLDKETSGKTFIPAHKNFRVIAIGAPVPPFPGYPLDPPFRSRFQSRFIDPLASSRALSESVSGPHEQSFLWKSLCEIILSTQLASETRIGLAATSKSMLPPFPQTALLKLSALIAEFPPQPRPTPTQLARVILLIHPALSYAPFQVWAMLSRQAADCGLELAAPSMVLDSEPAGFFGYRVSAIERNSSNTVLVTFGAPVGLPSISRVVPAGSRPLVPFPLADSVDFKVTERFMGLLTCMLQSHCLGWDISLVPSAASAASASTSTLVRTFCQVLGYKSEVVHLYKEIGGRELVMRRKITQAKGETIWEPSPVVTGALEGSLVHLSAFDVIGPTANALSRLIQDRQLELWDGQRITAENIPASFRIIATASKSQPLKDWLSEEHVNLFFTIPSQPMHITEELSVLLSTGCPAPVAKQLLKFAERYRLTLSVENVQKSRKLGTRSLVRISKKIATFPDDFHLRHLLRETLLSEFLPITERSSLEALFTELQILENAVETQYSPPILRDGALVFPHSEGGSLSVPVFDKTRDPFGVASLVPQMEHFYNNSIQTSLLRDLAVDLEVFNEHLVLLGNQGVGKNKLIDRLCQLLGRPREYIQLHRDTTVNQLMFTTSTTGGVIQYTDSPLLRAITFGRVIIIDEADKAPEHVVAIFRSLATHSEMTLSDGRRVCVARQREGDIEVHPDFRLILLANRPGYPFLGNHFIQVLGENFSPHAVSNPDQLSERQILTQLAPNLDDDLICRLVAAFQDLRAEYDKGLLSYPYSLRELINLVKHLDKFPDDTLVESLRNVFDFDVHRPETIDRLARILEQHGLHVPHLGLEAVRENKKTTVQEIQFEPKENKLGEPKEGVHDKKQHSGGNRFMGGVGGRDTAGMGGRGGYKRFYKGGDVKQVSKESKNEVPDHIKERAREMAQQELQRRLEELNMSISEATGYNKIVGTIDSQVTLLHNLFENLAAKEEERIWMKRQIDGELDDTRLVEGLTGENAVYKRRGMEKPELGRPQLKPKRIRFVFDLSASMYRFQYDGRLQRTIETATMLMEMFGRLSRKDKYLWDIYAHSGDGPDIVLVAAEYPPDNVKERWKVIEKMNLIPQYAFAGDYTVEAIQKGVDAVAKCDADDWFLIALTDANFGQYDITPEQLSAAMKRHPKVHTALICIGEGADTAWVTENLPGQAFRVANTGDIPIVLRSILTTMVDR